MTTIAPLTNIDLFSLQEQRSTPSPAKTLRELGIQDQVRRLS
ncbi:hypothetical protein [Nostoc sp. CALU 546]